MVNHTPGPWAVGVDLVGVILNKRDDTGQSTRDNCTKNGWAKTVCKITHASWAGVEEHVANARLIAAAPDLLAAARKAENYIANTESELGITLDCGTELRAAIAKAEGLTPTPTEGERG